MHIEAHWSNISTYAQQTKWELSYDNFNELKFKSETWPLNLNKHQ